jgi:pimeloyl-ACP methyl ester carboxylesterase
MVRKVLFVCGFNPQSLCSWNTHYDAVRAFFDTKPDLVVEYFSYTWSECAESVYARLSSALASDKHDVIVAHSMGCTLVARYFTRHEDKLAGYQNVVLCMPLITNENALHALLARVPLVGLVPLLTMLALPSSALFADGMCEGESSLGIPRVFCGQQLVHAYRRWIPKLDMKLLASANVHVVYATEDTLCPMSSGALARATNLWRVAGKHEAFNARRSSRAFFAALTSAIAEPVELPAI